MPRSGSVSGNQVQLSGLFAVPNAGGVHYTQNSFTALGIISDNETRIDFNGSGIATGTWEGMGFSCSGTSTAVFTRSSALLTVTKAGPGSGTVTSSPPGINCGPDCSDSYAVNTPVTLTASPAPGSTVAGWSGDPDCADGSVTMNASKTCTATFNLTGPPLTPAAPRQLLNVTTFRGPMATATTEQRAFLPTDPLLAGATYYDPTEACLGVQPAGVKFFVFTLEGQLVLGRNRDSGGVTNTQIGTSPYQALLATLAPGALPPGFYSAVFWVKDCTNTYVLVSELYAVQVLAP